MMSGDIKPTEALTAHTDSKDVVDYVHTENNLVNVCSKPTSQNENHKNNNNNNNSNNNNNNTINSTTFGSNLNCALINKKCITGTLYGDCEVKTTIKSSLSNLEKLSLFKLQLNKKTDINDNKTLELVKEKPKFVKGMSIARLLGNTYSTKKQENNKSNDKNTLNFSNNNGQNYFNNCNKKYRSERFQKCTKLEDDINNIQLKDFCEDKDLGIKAFRTISRSLGKLWWKRTHSVDISIPDPEYKVCYLGNVLTGWAKGEGCVEKPLNTLWRNYTQNYKPDVIMRMRVTASGLKATTRQHGLTEYWANRITHCSAPKNFPRVFCWVYRHEGRKLKHEMRCHAVLCAKDVIAQEICTTLRENLDRALREFKREKILKQNARLSLANSLYDNPSLPRRKILLSVGGNNYRPPLERSKSAPKLMAIEEAVGEEEEEEKEEERSLLTKETKMPSCCQRDLPYSAMTLGRRRCRRGHSFRRSGRKSDVKIQQDKAKNETKDENESKQEIITKSCIGSEEDFDNILNSNDYDIGGELLSYLDMKLMAKTTSLTNLDDDNIQLDKLIITDPRPRPALSLDNLDNYSDTNDDNESCEDYFQQQSIINKNNNKTVDDENQLPIILNSLNQQQNLDSDEGSISSGCETSSTITANMDDTSLKYIQQITQCNNNKKDNKNDMLPDNIDKPEMNLRNDLIILNNIELRTSNKFPKLKNHFRSIRGATGNNQNENDASDSEMSDESGYVEYQEQNLLFSNKSIVA